MVDNDSNRHDRAAAPATGRNRWLPWVMGALVLLGLILLLRSCGDDDRAADVADDGTIATTGAADTAATDPALAAGGSMAWNANAFGTYLAGNEALGRTFGLERVTFASGSSLLRGDALSEVQEVAAALKARPTARVTLRGYADPAGDAAANQELSETRTQAVRNALIKAGAGENQIVAAEALGETGNAATARNRRVEITVDAR